MTYAMTLDNSWEMMSEDEMYDVNGGFSYSFTTVFGVPVGAEARFSNEALNTFLGLIDAGMTFSAGLLLLGVTAKVAAPLAAAGLILLGVMKAYAALGWGFAYGFVGNYVYHRPIF